MAGERTILERIRGKRMRDIELPNESGSIDPRLKGKTTSEAIQKAAMGMKILQRKGLIGNRSAGGKR